MIDWETFRARVQAGTRVRVSDHIWINNREISPLYRNIKNQEGILIRHGREIYGKKTQEVRWKDVAYVHLFQHISARELPVDGLSFLIDGRWLSYDELMAGDA